jgi:hypothetical protein
MIPTLTALLLMMLVSCLLFVVVYAVISAASCIWARFRLRRPLPEPTTREYRLVTDLARWRALRGSGAERFKLSEWR